MSVPTTFYNNYFIDNNSGRPHTTNHVLQVGDFIYSIANRYVITKLNLLGEVVWSKTYVIDDSFGYNSQYSSIIECYNSDIILEVISDYSGRIVGLIRINGDGDVIWSKNFSIYLANGNIGFSDLKLIRIQTNILPQHISEEIYILKRTYRNIVGTTQSTRNLICKLDGEGNIIDSKYIEEGFLQITDINTIEEEIILCGNYRYRNGQAAAKIYLIKLNLNLEIVEQFSYELPTDSSKKGINVRGVYYHDYSLYIVGNVYFNVVSEYKTYFAKILIDRTSGSPEEVVNTISFKEHNHYHSYFKFQEDFIYICQPYYMNYKFDHNLNLLWAKTSTSSIHGNSISITQVKDNRLIVNSNNGIQVGRLDLDLNACNIFDVNLEIINQQIKKGLKPSFNIYDVQVPSGIDFSISLTDAVVTSTEICPPSLDYDLYIQSKYLYLQSAGSTGQDGSAKGIHLRWLLKDKLQIHLPKGDLAANDGVFNQPNDFVNVYRASYSDSNLVKQTINFESAPSLIDDANNLWVYKTANSTFFINFLDKDKYTQTRSSLDPLTQSIDFLRTYGDSIIEIENREELFFFTEFNFQSTTTNSSLGVELLSVEENKITATKNIIARKVFNATNINATTDKTIFGENVRSVRFKATDCIVSSIELALYNENIKSIEDQNGWRSLGKFSLSTDESEVFRRLEPTQNLINGKWQRYNDNAFVNIDNYKQKWNADPEKSIKSVVNQYVSLSNNADNPTALETFNFSDSLPDGATADSFEISNLFLLQMAAMDYHVARMLGLGHLDVSNEVQTGKYYYLLEYFTTSDLQDGQGKRNVRHLYMTPPTGIDDEKLPKPVNLKEPVLGLVSSATNSSSSPIKTDGDGYSSDGKTHYVSLFSEELEELNNDSGFFNNTTEFNIVNYTEPIFAGIEYKLKGQPAWLKPELANTPDYKNYAASGEVPHNETVPIPIPENGKALFVNNERETGIHVYSSYGINWFSRATQSEVQWEVETIIKPKSKLLPPHNINALLVTKEQPLLLTSAKEQQMFEAITDADKTLVRLTFDYNHTQELISYKKTPKSMGTFTDALDPNAIFPDNQEVLPEEIELFFRDEVPKNVTGKVKSIIDDTANEVLTVIRTEKYRLISNGQEIIPNITDQDIPNYVGGVFVLEKDKYVIHSVEQSGIATEGPIFKLYKKEVSDSLLTNTIPNAGSTNLISPSVKSDGLFMAIENMQNPVSWGGNNPHPLKIKIGANWPIHREIITREGADDNLEEWLEKTRGVWGKALVEKENEVIGYNSDKTPILGHKGLYKATFNTVLLNQHPQYKLSDTNPENNINSVEWYKGIVRLHTKFDVNGNRKSLEVVKIDNIGNGANLIIYFIDRNYPKQPSPTYDEVLVGSGIEINFYPGYKVYLYKDDSLKINQQNILPQGDETIKYSVFGLRTVDRDPSPNKYSAISIPQLMFAQKVLEPLIPESLFGVKYATRPDSYGRSTYTFTANFKHKPYGVLYYRANEYAILNALYEKDTIQVIKEKIGRISDENFLDDRWKNLLSFDYNYTDGVNENGMFSLFPVNLDQGYRLPNPDKKTLFSDTETPGGIKPSDMIERIKTAITNVFVPLTEMPVIYQYIRDERIKPYQPIAKKQVIRDRNGYLLKPTDPAFDIAPMAKIVDDNKLLFTDFTLDGTSDNVYFYMIREVGNTMQIGDTSEFLGPIRLVNTKPPQTPEIKRVLPILANDVLKIKPSIEFEINAYPQVQNIKKINIYRAIDATDAVSLRTMQLVKTIDISNENLSDQSIWKFNDTFEDLDYVPYADPLYYRLTVLREVEYADKDGQILKEFAPSSASKLIISTIVDSKIPIAPKLTYSYDESDNFDEIKSVIIRANKVVHNATYYLYKMNSQGNWIKIHHLKTNENEIQILLSDTTLSNGTLQLVDSDDNAIYHHFKIEVENSSGMFSTNEEILTIPNDLSVNLNTGIGNMIIGNTNIIR